MSDKNHNGALYHRHKRKEKLLIETMVKREKEGTNKENTDSTYNTYHINTEGARVWTF